VKHVGAVICVICVCACQFLEIQEGLLFNLIEIVRGAGTALAPTGGRLL
jgi:hypothetical protein